VITVIAGVNGAGKSSIAGRWIRHAGGEYFNPDEVAAKLKARHPHLSATEANAHAWQAGYQQLRSAIEERADFSLETTLGGNSICQLLHQAIDQGQPVRIFFVGLATPELHIQRVDERVARGGHAIPAEKIRQRWVSTIHNMMGLIPRCAAVRVIDNSTPADAQGPHPQYLFSLQQDRFDIAPVDPMPDWAKPLAAIAITRVLN
jgi:predicted ABC-type ATPase